MRPPPELPAGFVCERSPGHLAVVRSELREAAAGAGLLSLPSLEQRLETAGGASGRAVTAALSLPGGAELMVRPVLHGGWLGPWLGGAMWGVRRPLRELRTTEALRRRAAPVPTPALVVAARRFGPLWRGYYATLRIEGAEDGLAYLASRPPRREMLAAARAAGRALRTLHDAGGEHPDLHIKNLLVRRSAGSPEVFVVDLDRARLVAQVSDAERMRELMRLFRSLRKRGLVGIVGARGCVALWQAYLAGDRALRARLLARLPREQLRIALHAWRYRP